MFKLLTAEERQKVVREYVIRRTIIILLGVISVSVVGIIGFLPSYVLSNARQSDALERTRLIDASVKKGDETTLQAWLIKTKGKLQLLAPELDIDRPSDFVDKIVAQKIAGIRIKGLSWTKAGNTLALSVSGVALDRQVLIEFEESLNSSGNFSAVTIPVSNLVRDKDIDFQVKLSPPKKK